MKEEVHKPNSYLTPSNQVPSLEILEENKLNN